MFSAETGRAIAESRGNISRAAGRRLDLKAIAGPASTSTGIASVAGLPRRSLFLYAYFRPRRKAAAVNPSSRTKAEAGSGT